MLLYRIWTYVRLVILAMSLSVYVCDFVEGMYSCKTGNFENEPL